MQDNKYYEVYNAGYLDGEDEIRELVSQVREDIFKRAQKTLDYCKPGKSKDGYIEGLLFALKQIDKKFSN